MKRISLLLATACMLTLGSCEDDLDQTPLSNGSVPAFFKTAVDFEQAMNAVYSQLRGYPDRVLILSDLRSDNFYGVSSQGVRDWDAINNFNTTLSVSPYMSDTWASDFGAIFRANTMLDQLKANGSVVSEGLRLRYEGEARFLRAFHYFDLVRMFGRVPVIDKALLPQEVAKIPRGSVEEVYNLIIGDLEYAKDNLPLNYTGANVGRVTSGAAKGLLALVYLTRSGPTYGIDGPGLASNENNKALALLNEVIDSKRYSLVSSYANVFSYTNENNSEVLFDVQYIVGNGATHPGVMVPDNYFTSLQIPFGSRGIEIKPVSNDFLSILAANDDRRAASVQTGYLVANVAENRTVLKKYISAAGRGTGNTDWPINFIVMRYADILLMKAEAILRGGGGTQADALKAVNEVRTRAKQPALTSLTMAQLLDERRREFLGEGLRWHDLVRSGTVLTTMNAWIAKEDASGKMRRNIGANDIIYAVPLNELSATPGLYDQNPGY
ncbi:RagB/SusD family nutrient uptake outer membrane protein [Hymenobacter qilianensis]|uniref:RagB/SusD family nutrient uptake outer membrane protein n=2 Tax=Hymenobacter qilianensis TaxID=1385715 RepID=A0A7H0GVA3_9BACT|nr:RagB/SusD family nutrient uptake outer membrane protein [Hymenobacter qilianensis]QNP52219.1 RagB/SusD family nutrient uptake outer membrane protein [Hymenobacter qilianensis]